ncbi:MAG: TRAP transporter substrate-binding protein DctP [Sedimenticolaceae bacterium]|jgi:TRAP-type C4-dicarboxylate transport system substrate-binding protein
MKKLKLVAAALVTAGLLSACSEAPKEVSLKASHQWPGGKGDMRDEMVQMIARHMKDKKTGVNIQVYPGKSLFKPKEQWGAMTKGQLDMTAFPLSYAGGKHPEFNLTLMPGLVKNHDHALRLNKSAFMDKIKKIMDDAGVMVLADTWLAGGFVSTGECILEPKDVKGMKFRAAGKAFNQMLAAAGATITSMPSSEIYSGLQTGVLDGANTSSSSLVSYRIYEQVKCLTEPGDNALWVMYEPILMAKASFEKLSPAQQKEILAAGKAAEQYASDQAKLEDGKLVDTYKKAGVKVVKMSAEQAAMWRDIADKSSYDAFAKDVAGGRELLDMALSVQ